MAASRCRQVRGITSHTNSEQECPIRIIRVRSGSRVGRALFEREFKEIELSIAVVWFTVLVQELVQLALSERVVDQGCSEPWSMFGSGGR
jgi:hypothetical protein